ncbi:MAG: hypothetical protein WCW17_01555 [Patescibacteria group bacterium]|jgi:hypothetical protein
MGKKISTKVGIYLLIIVAVIFAGGALAYFYYYQPTGYDYEINGSDKVVGTNNKNTNTNLIANSNANANINLNTNSTADETVDWKTYTNNDYGFSLTFTDAWKGYKLMPVNLQGTVKTLYINVPTTDLLYASDSETHFAGYTAPFAVSVINKYEWQDDEFYARDFGSKVGENEDYIFTSSSWQACPTDLCESEIPKSISIVIDSFTAFAVK